MFGPERVQFIASGAIPGNCTTHPGTKKCWFPLMSRCYKTVEIVSNEKGTLNSNMPLYF